MTLKLVLSILARVVGIILAQATPRLREALIDFLTERYREALKTSNPWDDMLFRVLLIGCGIPVPES